MRMYVETLHKIDFEDMNFQTWIPEAKDRNIWGKRVEYYLNLQGGFYSTNNRYSLKSYSCLQNKTLIMKTQDRSIEKGSYYY